MEALLPVLIAAGAFFVIIAGNLLLILKCYRRIPIGKALVLSTMRGDFVRRGAAVVLPIVNHAEIIDLAMTPIRITRRNEDALLTRDEVRADLDATFILRVNDTDEDILKVARSAGCARATDLGALTALLGAKFSSALVAVVRHMTYDELTTKRTELQDKLIEIVGQDLNGYTLDDVAVDHVARAKAEHDGPFR